MKGSRERIERRVRACYGTWAETYYDNYHGAGAPYPPVYRDHIRRWLLHARARSVLDAGCGPASFLRDLPQRRMELFGFDLTPEMVAEARRALRAKHVPPENVWEGSVLDPKAFRQPANRRRRFDAAVCVGVLPHIPAEADEQVLGNLRRAVVHGGLVVVEARNQFFSAFTLNRYTHGFFRDDLIRAADLQQRAGSELDALRDVLKDIESHFRTDVPPIRRGTQGEPGYDEVLSRAHHPFELKDLMTHVGFKDVRLVFYHHHCVPPMFEKQIPALFREESLRMDARPDWRGAFMASAFLLAGTRR